VACIYGDPAVIATGLNLVIVSLVPNGRDRTCALGAKKYAVSLKPSSFCDELFGCHVSVAG
jgi:hypothetical protein